MLMARLKLIGYMQKVADMQVGGLGTSTHTQLIISPVKFVE